MEENRFWAYKVIQFLHDPPGKPFLFFPGSGGHRALARELWDMIFKEKPRFFSYADWIASGADRPVIKGLGTIYFHKNPLITHPLTKSHIKLTLPSKRERVTLEEIDELKELQKSSLERLIEHIEGVEGNKTAFFNLWRLFRKELIKDDPDIPWRFIPADSRCPDHSIWEHNRLTSALAFITQGLVKKNGQPRDINDPDYPWLFSFSLRSPQSFLKEARKSQDLWTGSMLISDLVFAGMVPIIEHYGPDVVIYPDLLANPRADIWLCYGKEDTISTEFKSQLKGVYSRASVIPHTFVAILPRGGEGHLKSIEDIGNEVLKAIGKRWGKYVSLAKNWMESKISLTKAKLWHDTWKAFQNISPVEPIWIAVPWIPCERQDNYYFPGRTLPCQETERPPKGDFEIIKRRFFKLGFWVPEEVWARYEYSRSVFARTKEEYYLNSGFNYSLLHYKLKAQHMLRKLYSALPETHKQNKENLDLSRKTKGMTEKCTLCKSRPVIADYKEEPGDHAESIRAKLKEFWSNTDLDPAGEGKERLCPVCATKRFLVKNIINSSDEELKHLWLPDTEEKFLADKNFEGLHLAGVPCKNEKPLSGWVSSQNLFWALSNRGSSKWNENEYSSEDLPPFVWWEFKPGLGIDRERRAAKEGMLYFLSSLRFKDNAGLIGWFKGKLAERLSENALKRGVITAGKKWGVMAFEETSLKDPYWEKLAKGAHLKDISLPASFYVWIVLLSPGKPPYKEALERPLLKIAQQVSSDISIEVVSVITGKSVKFSGFSFVEKRPKRISHWFPPGASFLVRVSGGSLEERKQVLLLWNNTCVFAAESFRAFGYGHIIVSVPIEKSWREKWKEEEIYW